MNSKPSSYHEQLVGKLLKKLHGSSGMWEDTYQASDGTTYGSIWSGVICEGDLVVCVGFVGVQGKESMMKFITSDGDARFMHFIHRDWKLL